MRIDIYLFRNGLAESRSKAQALLGADAVRVNGHIVNKPSFEVSGDENIEVKNDKLPFVSRGGLKLLCALESFGVDLSGLVVCDIGASTGGFTDCALQRGAKKVYAVDSGHGQLHEKLRNDKRVISFEGLNAKNLTGDVLGEMCDAVVSDLSFISQTKVYGPVTGILKENGIFISLIKPQFEAGQQNVGSGGIVRDKKVHAAVIRNITAAAKTYGLIAKNLCRSPIKGGDGNTEYLMLFKFKDGDVCVHEEDIIGTVG